MKKMTALIGPWILAAALYGFSGMIDVLPPTVALMALLATTFGLLAGWLAAQNNDVDPWKLQRQIMAISDQELPVNPTFSPGVLLYYALQLEEMSETTQTIRALLHYHRHKLPDRLQRNVLLSDLGVTCNILSNQSEELRNLLSFPSDGRWTIPLPQTQAKMLLDDVLDVTVVTAGLALAAGLPAQAGYNEVHRSNLSKANTETGKIDKDAGGKWIKGPNYTPPQLDAVLSRAWSGPFDPPM